MLLYRDTDKARNAIHQLFTRPCAYPGHGRGGLIAQEVELELTEELQARLRHIREAQ